MVFSHETVLYFLEVLINVLQRLVQGLRGTQAERTQNPLPAARLAQQEGRSSRSPSREQQHQLAQLGLPQLGLPHKGGTAATAAASSVSGGLLVGTDIVRCPDQENDKTFQRLGNVVFYGLNVLDAPAATYKAQSPSLELPVLVLSMGAHYDTYDKIITEEQRNLTRTDADWQRRFTMKLVEEFPQATICVAQTEPQMRFTMRNQPEAVLRAYVRNDREEYALSNNILGRERIDDTVCNIIIRCPQLVWSCLVYSPRTCRMEIDLHTLVSLMVREGNVLIVAANRWVTAEAIARFIADRRCGST